MLSNLVEGDVLFIDEIHRIARPAEEMLYLAMEDFRVDVVVGKGPGATSIPLEIAPFTLVGATTRSGALTGPLRDRFGFTAHMEFYDPPSWSWCCAGRRVILGIDLRPDGAAEIAGRSRGTPRIANRLLRRVRDFAQVRADGSVDRRVARAALAVYDVDELGLDRLDRAVLGAPGPLVRRRAGRADHAGGRGGGGAGYRRGGLRALPGAGRDAGPHPPGPGGHRGRLEPSGNRGAAGRHPGWPSRVVLNDGLADSAAIPTCGDTEIMDLTSLLFPLLILLLFIPIFLSGRRQRKQMQEMQALQNALEPGDVVTTTSGLRGTVVDASYEDTVDLEIADGVVTTWVRAAVKNKVPAEPAAPVVADDDEPAVVEPAPAAEPIELTEPSRSGAVAAQGRLDERDRPRVAAGHRTRARPSVRKRSQPWQPPRGGSVPGVI